MYKHTQCVPAGVLTTVGTIGGIGSLLAPKNLKGIVGVSMASLLFTFRSMTVSIAANELVLEFGNWLKVKTISLSDIEDVSVERMSPIHGWGIHFVGEGWLYNVYGLDAVKVTLKNGEKIFIGTDEAPELESSLRSSIQSLQPV